MGVAVLKAETAQGLGLSPVSWLDTRAEAAAIVARAHAEAARILAGAQAEAAKVLAGAGEARAQAEREGRIAGEAAGKDEALAEGRACLDAELPSMKEALAGLAGALKALPDQVAARTEAGTVGLALAVAGTVLKRELKLDPGLVVGNLKAAIAALAVVGRLTLRLHPEDRALLESILPELVAGLSPEPVELVSDPSITRGGCIASSSGAMADATLDSQLKEIRKALLGEDA